MLHEHAFLNMYMYVDMDMYACTSHAAMAANIILPPFRMLTYLACNKSKHDYFSDKDKDSCKQQDPEMLVARVLPLHPSRPKNADDNSSEYTPRRPLTAASSVSLRRMIREIFDEVDQVRIRIPWPCVFISLLLCTSSIILNTYFSHGRIRMGP